MSERIFEVRSDKSVEPLLYIGLDATPYSACSPQSKPSADVVRYHKSIASAYKPLIKGTAILSGMYLVHLMIRIIGIN